MSGGQLSKQMNQYFSQDGAYKFNLNLNIMRVDVIKYLPGGEAAKYDATEEPLAAADKVDAEAEVAEELCDTAAVADTAQPAAAEQEAGVAN